MPEVEFWSDAPCMCVPVLYLSNPFILSFGTSCYTFDASSLCSTSEETIGFGD